MIWGYARVSTNGQTIEAQLNQLRDAGGEKVFGEVASGAKKNRAQVNRVLSYLVERDILMMTRLDRLACSPRGLLHTLASVPRNAPAFDPLASNGRT